MDNKFIPLNGSLKEYMQDFKLRQEYQHVIRYHACYSNTDKTGDGVESPSPCNLIKVSYLSPFKRVLGFKYNVSNIMFKNIDTYNHIIYKLKYNESLKTNKDQVSTMIKNNTLNPVYNKTYTLDEFFNITGYLISIYRKVGNGYEKMEFYPSNTHDQRTIKFTSTYTLEIEFYDTKASNDYYIEFNNYVVDAYNGFSSVEAAISSPTFNPKSYMFFIDGRIKATPKNIDEFRSVYDADNKYLHSLFEMYKFKEIVSNAEYSPKNVLYNSYTDNLSQYRFIDTKTKTFFIPSGDAPCNTNTISSSFVNKNSCYCIDENGLMRFDVIDKISYGPLSIFDISKVTEVNPKICGWICLGDENNINSDDPINRYYSLLNSNESNNPTDNIHYDNIGNAWWKSDDDQIANKSVTDISYMLNTYSSEDLNLLYQHIMYKEWLEKNCNQVISKQVELSDGNTCSWNSASKLYFGEDGKLLPLTNVTISNDRLSSANVTTNGGDVYELISNNLYEETNRVPLLNKPFTILYSDYEWSDMDDDEYQYTEIRSGMCFIIRKPTNRDTKVEVINKFYVDINYPLYGDLHSLVLNDIHPTQDDKYGSLVTLGNFSICLEKAFNNDVITNQIAVYVNPIAFDGGDIENIEGQLYDASSQNDTDNLSIAKTNSGYTMYFDKNEKNYYLPDYVSSSQISLMVFNADTGLLLSDDEYTIGNCQTSNTQRHYTQLKFKTKPDYNIVVCNMGGMHLYQTRKDLNIVGNCIIEMKDTIYTDSINAYMNSKRADEYQLPFSKKYMHVFINGRYVSPNHIIEISEKRFMLCDMENLDDLKWHDCQLGIDDIKIYVNNVSHNEWTELMYNENNTVDEYVEHPFNVYKLDDVLWDENYYNTDGLHFANIAISNAFKNHNISFVKDINPVYTALEYLTHGELHNFTQSKLSEFKYTKQIRDICKHLSSGEYIHKKLSSLTHSDMAKFRQYELENHMYEQDSRINNRHLYSKQFTHRMLGRITNNELSKLTRSVIKNVRYKYK